MAVEGSDDGVAWVRLVDEAWVFAVPGEEEARYETVDLPENDFQRLRVVVHPAPDESGRPGIEDAWVPGDGRPPRGEERLVARWSEAQDPKARETWLTLDLGSRHQPFHAVELDVADERFFREARVEARLDPRAPGGAPGWEEIGRGALYRLDHESRRGECLRIEARGRERALRVRVRNLDDRPLQFRAVALRVPEERLLFEAERPGLYRLTYGSPDRTTPSYDLARTAGDLAAWIDAVPALRLGPPRRLTVAREEDRPWTERHPSLLWGGLSGRRGAGGADLRGAPPGRLRAQRGREAFAVSQRRRKAPRSAGRTALHAALVLRSFSRATIAARASAHGSSQRRLFRHRAREHGNERAVPDAAGGPKERGHDGAGTALDRLPQIVEGDPAVEGRERLVDRGARPKRGRVSRRRGPAGPAARGPRCSAGMAGAPRPARAAVVRATASAERPGRTSSSTSRSRGT